MRTAGCRCNAIITLLARFSTGPDWPTRYAVPCGLCASGRIPQALAVGVSTAHAQGLPIVPQLGIAAELVGRIVPVSCRAVQSLLERGLAGKELGEVNVQVRKVLLCARDAQIGLGHLIQEE